MRFHFLSLTRLFTFAPRYRCPLLSGAVALGLFFGSPLLRATALTLRWDDNSTNESGFKIERSTDGTTYAALAWVGVNVTAYTDSTVGPGLTYWYRVRAYDSRGTSGFSNAVSVTTPFVPGRVAIFTARSVTGKLAARPLILGFAVSGTGKSILLRGIGPGQKTFTGSPLLADPFLDFYAGPTLLAHNDNWGGTSTLTYLFQRYGAFPLESTSKDAALKMSVTVRSYTAAVNGSDAGIAQAELYDTDSGSAPTGRFSKLSALAQVGTGSGVLTAGMVIKGDKGVRVLMRAIGPSLTGVAGVLQNPVLSLYRNGVLVQRNDNWGGSSTLTSTFTQAGASSLSPTSSDAAMTATLLPGFYSATVGGVYSSVGAARLELYTLP